MDDALKQVKNFVDYVLSQLCDHPEDIQLDATTDERGNLITVKVNDADMGRLIGRNGKTISSLRLLVRSMGSRLDTRTTLRVIEPGREKPAATSETETETTDITTDEE